MPVKLTSLINYRSIKLTALINNRAANLLNLSLPSIVYVLTVRHDRIVLLLNLAEKAKF